MHCRFLFVLTLTLCSAGGLLLPQTVRAEVPFTSAVVQNLRNQVRLLLKNQAPRPAQRLDRMTPGDALATARAALAEMRFNDGSTTRIGEQTLFRFQPNTRSFRLDNGTALFIIPPGQGETRVRTPNAAAGIRGSALFVRYNPDTQTTLIGALTNSQIEVSNQDKSQSQTLKAGQMAVIIQNRLDRVYDFDLNTFYETSELVKGLDLPRRNATAHPDPAIAAVQLETAEAIRGQSPLIGQGIVSNPTFVRLAGEATTLIPPTLGRDFDRTGFTGISAFTGVASDLRRLSSGKQIPAESGAQAGAQVIVSAPPALTSSPSLAVTTSPLLVSPIGGSPAPLPSNPSSPEVPATPTLPPAPIVASPAPIPSTPTPPGTVTYTPPTTLEPANPAPAPAPLPPATAVVVQPPVTSTVIPTVQPPVTPAVQPPAAVVVQPPTITITVIQPSIVPPAAIVVQPPTPTVVQPPAPAPAPLPPASAVVQPPAASVVAPPSTPINLTPVQTVITPAITPAVPTPAGAATPAAIATPPAPAVPVTPASIDRPPITPTANPAVQSAPVLPTTPAELSPASSLVAPAAIK